MTIRQSVVAGSFYPGTKHQLEETLKKLIPGIPDNAKYAAKGVVSPHAGYIYSGGVAGSVFAHIVIPEIAVILAPNHTGMGESFALWPDGKWLTPLGTAEIDEELTRLIKESSPLVKEDTLAHLREHSAEVQLPFLQYLNRGIKVVVIVIGSTNLRELKSFGKSLGEVLRTYPKSNLVIASSDMTHYEPHEIAQEKDKKAIAKILVLDPDGLYETVYEHDISMCGFAPTIAMLSACKALGAQSAKLVKYQTSGDTSGDYSQVVGYAGITVS